MKDYTGIIILASLIAGLFLASKLNTEAIKNKGGHVETIFNTPIKQIFKH
jgi:hypothetical protein